MSPDEHSSPDTPTDDSGSPSQPRDLPPAHDVTTYVEDGARIAAILGVWGVVAAFAAGFVGNLGSTGGLLSRLGPALGGLFLLVGLLNAVLYLVYRGIDYARA